MEIDKKTDQYNQIGGENESNCVSFVLSKTASWPILHGSLDDSVICESSLSPVDSDGNPASPKPALVLRRTSHDCGPCEIKISFEQKHEIRQVYVKSTARVYEIYYAADTQSMNEYLCTVRCGLAAKTEECLANEYLQNMDAVTSISPSSTGSNKLLEELKTESGGSTNEDGWVEIKDPDPSLTEDGDSSCSNKTEVRIERENQDFYEATAEISDANPCTSMTIRLLSLQSGESVYLDDVYVFSDPVECDDANSTSNEVERSTGNPLMSMLVPTLLQLSKSRMSQISEQLNPTSKLKNAEQDVSQNMYSASTYVKIQKEENPSVSNEQAKVTDKLECPDQSTSLEVPRQPSKEHDKSGTTNGMNESSYNLGKTLDQLVSRIARIEEFCLSFERRMINPITSMDTRLGEVEKQLKSLNEKFKLPEVHSFTTTHAPDLSCSDSVLGQFHIDVKSLEKGVCLSFEVPAPSSDIPSAEDASSVPIVITAPEFSISSVPLENGDGFSDEIANQASNIPSIASARAHLVPSLVVTAPEFSYCEEEEDDDDSKSVGDSSPRDILKKPVSIDDALADALAGFVSSTSIQDSTRALDPDTSKIDNLFVSQHFEKDELVVTNNETFVEAAAENEENDVLIFGSYSEPTLEIIAGDEDALVEDSAHNFFVHDAENGENDVLIFGSYSEPTLEIIAEDEDALVEDSARNFIVHDAENGENDVLIFGSYSEPTLEIIAGDEDALVEDSAHNFFVHDAENGENDVLIFGSYSEPTLEIIAEDEDALVEDSARNFIVHDAENGENDVLIFGSYSEPTLEIIAGDEDALVEDSAHNFFVHDAENGEKSENDVLIFGSYSEPTLKIIAGDEDALVEDSAHNFFVHDAENVITEEVDIENDDKDANKADSSSGEMVMKEDSSVLHGILDLPINSAVDYKIPILDVKFASRESSNLSFSIEALLLTETTEADITDQDHSLETDNNGVRTLNAGDDLLVDLGHDDSSHLSHTNNNEDVSVALF